MKKLVLATLVALSFTAGAVEVAVTGINTVSSNRYGYGLTATESVAGVNVGVGIARFTRENDDQTRYSLVASKEVAKLGPVGFDGRVGFAFLSNNTASSGSAVTVGVGASMPIAKNVSLVSSVDYQYGQRRVDAFNGSIITAGVKVGF